MDKVELNEDEIITVRKLISDWGFEYSLKASRDKILLLGRKLKMKDNEFPFFTEE